MAIAGTTYTLRAVLYVFLSSSLLGTTGIVRMVLWALVMKLGERKVGSGMHIFGSMHMSRETSICSLVYFPFCLQLTSMDGVDAFLLHIWLRNMSHSIVKHTIAFIGHNPIGPLWLLEFPSSPKQGL